MAAPITSVTISIQDSSGIVLKTITPTLSGGKWSGTCTLDKSSFLQSYTSPTGSGFYNVVVSATDAAGNSKTVTYANYSVGTLDTRLVAKSTQAPYVWLQSPTGSSVPLFNTNTPTMVFYATTANYSTTYTGQYAGVAVTGSNAPAIQISTDNSTWSDVENADISLSVINAYAESITYTPTIGLLNNTYYLKITTVDNDGNSGITYQSFAIDSSKPVAYINSPTSGAYYNTSTVTLSGYVTDDGVDDCTAEYQLDGTSGSWTSLTLGTASGNTRTYSTSVSTLTDGSHTFYVRATDLAGNVGDNASVTFTVDTLAPTFTSVTITPNPSDVEGTVTIEIVVS